MGIQFGVGTLKVLMNLPINMTVNSVSASTTTFTAAAFACIVEGVTCNVSSQAVQLTDIAAGGIAGATGQSGMLLFAYVPAGNNDGTGVLGAALLGSPMNTCTNIPTAICPLMKFSFGTGANVVSTLEVVSGGSATKTISKVQNVEIPVTYEVTQMRGDNDVFPGDTKFFDGKIEGSFDLADDTAMNSLFMGGTYASGGNASGVWSLSQGNTPVPVSLVFKNVTDGVTSTYTIMKALILQRTNDFSRTDFYQPSFNFVTQANFMGTVLKIQG